MGPVLDEHLRCTSWWVTPPDLLTKCFAHQAPDLTLTERGRVSKAFIHGPCFQPCWHYYNTSILQPITTEGWANSSLACSYLRQPVKLLTQRWPHLVPHRHHCDAPRPPMTTEWYFHPIRRIMNRRLPLRNDREVGLLLMAGQGTLAYTGPFLGFGYSRWSIRGCFRDAASKRSEN